MTTNKKEFTISGASISPGLVSGTAFVFRDIYEREQRHYGIKIDQVDQEYANVENAIGNVLEDLSLSADRIQKTLNSEMAEIFRAHEEMLRDVTLTNELRAEIEDELVNAEHAIQSVFERWERKFRSMKGDSFQQQGDDMADLGSRLMRSLAGVHTHSLEKMPKGSILVAQRLLPSDTTFFSHRSTSGIIVESGGPGSHFALLTRQMGIPGITQVPNLLKRVSTGDTLLLDGTRGTVTVSPDKNSQARFNKSVVHYQTMVADAKELCREAAITQDGVTISVLANIGNLHEAEMAVECGADGVGLFRIEVFFLSRKMLPTEAELIDEITRTIAPLKHKTISIRLLDVGGDKPLPYLPLPHESDPFLGRRGIRLLFEYPELFDLQLRALLRIAQDHDIQIIVPMVTIVEEMKMVRSALERVALELGCKVLPKLGAMIETPAAALCAAEIAAVSDLLNIGTNDLTQYTMAAGRENELVSGYFKDDHPAIIKLIEIVCMGGDVIPVGVCGELASKISSVETLLKTGVRNLSVPPPLIPFVKEAVRKAHAHLQECCT